MGPGILVASGQAPCGILQSVLDESLSTQGRPSLHSVLHPSAAVLERASPNHRNYIFLLNELCCGLSWQKPLIITEDTVSSRLELGQRETRVGVGVLRCISFGHFAVVFLHVCQCFLSSSCVQALR